MICWSQWLGIFDENIIYLVILSWRFDREISKLQLLPVILIRIRSKRRYKIPYKSVILTDNDDDVRKSSIELMSMMLDKVDSVVLESFGRTLSALCANLLTHINWGVKLDGLKAFLGWYLLNILYYCAA